MTWCHLKETHIQASINVGFIAKVECMGNGGGDIVVDFVVGPLKMPNFKIQLKLADSRDRIGTFIAIPSSQ